MGNVFASIHVWQDTDVKVIKHDHNDEVGEYTVLAIGSGSVFVNSREKLLEISSLLGQAAQRWGEK